MSQPMKLYTFKQTSGRHTLMHSLSLIVILTLLIIIMHVIHNIYNENYRNFFFNKNVLTGIITLQLWKLRRMILIPSTCTWQRPCMLYTVRMLLILAPSGKNYNKRLRMVIHTRHSADYIIMWYSNLKHFTHLMISMIGLN